MGGTGEIRRCVYCSGTGSLSNKLVCTYCCGVGYFEITRLEKEIISDSIHQKTKDDFIESLIAIIGCTGNQIVANELKRFTKKKEFSELD